MMVGGGIALHHRVQGRSMSFDILVRNTAWGMSWLLLFATLGCKQESTRDNSPPPTEVTVARPLVMPIVEWDEYTGRLEAIDTVEVRARVSGYLESTHFNVGQMVTQGDLLAIIDPRPFQAELNAAKATQREAEARLAESQSLLNQAEAERTDVQAQLALASRRLDRAKRLLVSRAVSQEEADILETEQLQAAASLEAANAKIESVKAGIATALAGIETARANVDSAALNYQYTQIRAPISGRISRRNVTEGNLIGGGSIQATLLTTIVSLNPIHCNFDANEQAFLKYSRLAKEGKRESSRQSKNPVYVALVDEVGFPHAGHMDFVDNRIDPNTGTIRGRAILSNDDGLLTPGLFVSVRLPGSGRYDAILIPDSAIGSDQADKFVYVSTGNSVRRQNIQLGPMSHGLRIVRSGLDESELIVTRGLQRIYPGVTLASTEEQIEADFSGDLPNQYEPIPEDEWLSRRPSAAPTGVPANAARYGESPASPVDEQQERP